MDTEVGTVPLTTAWIRGPERSAQSLCLPRREKPAHCAWLRPGPQPSLHGDHSAAAQPCRSLLPGWGQGGAAPRPAPTPQTPVLCTRVRPAPSPHPDVSTDAPRGLAEAPCLPCPVLPTSCLPGPPGKHPGPHSDGPLSAPGACCQGPGTHSLPGTGAPQGLALGWGPRGSAGGGGPRGLVAAVGSGWLDGAHQSEADLPPPAWAEGPTDRSAVPGVGQGPPGRRGTAEPSGQHSRPGTPEPWVGEVRCPHWDQALTSRGQRVPSDGQSPCLKPFLLG